MTTDSELSNILENWQKHTTDLHSAIISKIMRLFKYYLAQGTQCFKFVKDYIRKNTQVSPELKLYILSTSNKWTSAIDAINKWKAEVGIELRQTRHRKKASGKIRNAYSNKTKHLGINVSRKAR